MIALLAVLLSPSPAWARDDVPPSQKELLAESHRLEVDLDKLAQKLSWEGVERTYAKLLRLQVPLSTHVHYTAALSAQADGHVDLAWRRLERALRDLPALKEKPIAPGVTIKSTLPERVNEIDGDGAAARDSLDRLESTYGRVVIRVAPKRLPALVRLGSKPFTQTERLAIQHAQEALSKDFGFEGPLPVGRYMVDGSMFEAVVGGRTVVNVGL